MYRKIFKRLFDLTFSVLVVIIFSPVYFLTGIALAIDFKGNPFFTQKRNGMGGKEFKVVKFRSMTNERDADGKLLPNKDRLTPVGGFIRKTSLDELPQLFNVIRGDMSLIGPRPWPTVYYPYFEGEELERFNVRPGITGLAQVNGRNHLQWDKRLALDVEYARNLSLRLDMKILSKTIKNILGRKDIAVDPTTLMIDFDKYKIQKWNEQGK